MNVTQIAHEGLKHEFRVVVDKADIERQVGEKLQEISKRVKIAGFRPGKIPMTMLKQRYGSSVMGEVIEKAVQDSSAKAAAEKGLRPAMRPKIDIKSFGEDGQDLEYTMTVEVLPEIGDVKLDKIKLEKPVYAVSDSEIDEAVSRIAERHKSSEPVKTKRAAKLGDILTIDFDGSVDGEKRPGMKGEDFDLELGSHSFIDTFEDQLVGAKPGDDRLVTVTFPQDYGATELAGREAKFEVTVKALKTAVPAKLDDELAKKLGMEDMAALRKVVGEQLQGDFDGYTKLKLKRALLDAFADAYSFDVPPTMVEMEFDAIWKRVEEEMKSNEGAAEEKTEVKDKPKGKAKAKGKSEPDDEKAEYRKIAERRVRLGLLLNEIGRSQNLQVTQDELNRALMVEARNYPGQEQQIIDFYRKNPGAIENLRAPLYEDKVVSYVLSKVKLTDKPVSKDELIAMGDDEDEI